MTKLNIGLISLGALSIIGASGFGIYKALNKENKSISEKPLEIEKELVIEEEPIQKEIEVKKEDIPHIPPEEEVISELVPENNPIVVNEFADDENVGYSVKKGDFLLEGLPDGSIGKRFAKYFISSKDDPLWEKHVEIWKLNYNSRYRISLSKVFTPSKTESLTKENLLIRCENAHKRKSWTDNLNLRKSYDDNLYWSMVWQLCSTGKELEPFEWNN